MGVNNNKVMNRITNKLLSKKLQIKAINKRKVSFKTNSQFKHRLMHMTNRRQLLKMTNKQMINNKQIITNKQMMNNKSMNNKQMNNKKISQQLMINRHFQDLSKKKHKMKRISKFNDDNLYIRYSAM
jgi:hypothetical protein